jgi:hypothetical protein
MSRVRCKRNRRFDDHLGPHHRGTSVSFIHLTPLIAREDFIEHIIYVVQTIVLNHTVASNWIVALYVPSSSDYGITTLCAILIFRVPRCHFVLLFLSFRWALSLSWWVGGWGGEVKELQATFWIGWDEQAGLMQKQRKELEQRTGNDKI